MIHGAILVPTCTTDATPYLFAPQRRADVDRSQRAGMGSDSASTACRIWMGHFETRTPPFGSEDIQGAVRNESDQRALEGGR